MVKVLRHFFSPSGRVGRQNWWLSMVVLLGLLSTLNFAGGFLAGMYYCAKSPSDYYYVYCPANDFFLGTDPITDRVFYVSLAVWLWCMFATSTKRFHDQNRSAWWNLLNFIPFIGFFIWLVILGLIAGDDVTNRYGDGS